MGCGCALLWFLAVLQVVTGQNSNARVIENIRLVGGNDTAGRVEVMIGGTYGTVCDDQWDDVNAMVACRQLGLSGGKALTRAAYGQGTGPILLDDVRCFGEEKTLNDCYFSLLSNCHHSEDASVVCQQAGVQPTPSPVSTTTISGVTQPDNCQQGNQQPKKVTLFGPPNVQGVGYVQVQADNGVFGYVCDDGWDVNAAKIVCNELCYDPALAEPGMKKEYQVGVASPVNFAMDDVNCEGSEASLADCPHAPWFSHNCQDSEVASVTCVTVNYTTSRPPNPSLECRNGDLIALFERARDRHLEVKHLKLLGQDPPCQAFNVDGTDTNYITVTIPFDDCGTNVTQNETHIIYTNTIFMESTSREGAITSVNDYVIQLTCEMPRNATVDKEVRPLTETITQKAEGEFIVTMTIYQDRQFSNPATVYPFEVTLGDWLNTAIELESIDSRLKLVVTDCMASPNLSDSTAPTVNLLNNKCVEDRTTLELYPLSKVKFGLRLQSFIFVDYPLVTLQCDAIICLTSEVTSECDRSCNNSKPAPSGRRRRDVDETDAGTGRKTVYTVRSQPVVLVIPLLTPPTANPQSTTPLSTNATISTSSTASVTSPVTSSSPTTESASATTTTTATSTTPATTSTTPTTTSTTPTTTSTTFSTPSTTSATTSTTTTESTSKSTATTTDATTTSSTTKSTTISGTTANTSTTITSPITFKDTSTWKQTSPTSQGDADSTTVTARTAVVITVRGTGKPITTTTTTAVPAVTTRKGGIVVAGNGANGLAWSAMSWLPVWIVAFFSWRLVFPS